MCPCLREPGFWGYLPRLLGSACVYVCVCIMSKTEPLLSNGGICISHPTTFLVVRNECQQMSLSLLEWKQYVTDTCQLHCQVSNEYMRCARMFVCIIVRLSTFVWVIAEPHLAGRWDVFVQAGARALAMPPPQFQCPGWCQLIFVCAQQITYPLHPTTP